MVNFRTCDLFWSTAKKYLAIPKIKQQYDAFLKVKAESPMTPFGKTDYPFRGPILKGIKHVHLANDVILIYNISGRDPTFIDQYGFFSHDESGTGQPLNARKQANLAQRINNQKLT